MHPVLLKLGPIEIHAYGLLLAVSFMLGIYWAMARAPKRGIEKNDILDLSIVVVVCAIFGSRLFYVITHLDEFKGRWADTINPLQSSGEVGISGLSMLGGVVLVLIALVVYCRIKKISIVKLCDTLAPTFALGIGLTRIGCFLNGCCFGQPGDLAWCMKFPLNSPAGSVLQNIQIHPTQLYSSLYGFLILIVIVLVDRKKRPDGLLLSIFFMMYGVARFSIDFVRYYEASVQFHFLGLAFTFNQLISLVLFIIGLAYFIRLTLKKSAVE
ncbi:prolipoprotein diacylglyceryl transferase [candidate division KSB1 bacterium]|nr:prolipoprotein diacylglyceryl transferase [candidate division KSB1 bacterium]